MMNLTYKGHTYSLHSETAVLALVCWLLVQDADERIAA